MTTSLSSLYGAVAARYAARPHYPDALFKWLVDQTPVLGLAWDCGCGSGQASHDLAKYFAHVIATDASEEQINQASPNPKVTFKCATAERSGLPSGSVNLISVFMAAHWFDLDAFYAEVYRIAKPDAIVALFVYGEPTVEDDRLNEHVSGLSTLIAPYGGPFIQRMRNQYSDLYFPFEDELHFPEQEMKTRMTIDAFLNYTHSRASVIDYTKKKNKDPVATLERVLEERRAANPFLRVKWPLHGRVAKITKPGSLEVDQRHCELIHSASQVVEKWLRQDS